MRIGIVGTGFGARVMAPAFEANERCTVVEVVSARDEDATAALCRRRDVDLVAVHSPPFLHERDVLAALDAGHHVLCDKPFGLDEPAARRMLDAATASDRVHLVNFEFRCESWRRGLATLVASGALGAPRSMVWREQNTVWSRFAPGDEPWQLDRARGGGWLGASGSHMIDSIRWVLGAEFVGVRGVLHPAAAGHGDADSGASFHLELAGGAWAAATTSGVGATAPPPHVVIDGADATAWREVDGSIAVHSPGDGGPREVVPAEVDPFGSTLRRWVDAVCRAVEDGETDAPTFADGWACAAVLQRIRDR